MAVISLTIALVPIL